MKTPFITCGLPDLRHSLVMAITCFIVFSLLLLLFLEFNILTALAPSAGGLSGSSGQGRMSLRELMEIVKNRHSFPADIHMLDSLYFDRHPERYFPESRDKNLFRLLAMAVYWGLPDKREEHARKLEQLARATGDDMLRYRIRLFLAGYYLQRENTRPAAAREQLDAASAMKVPERIKSDLHYFYAMAAYLEHDYTAALRHILRTIGEKRFVSARLLQLLIHIVNPRNRYFQRMEAYKLSRNLFQQQLQDRGLYYLIIDTLLQEQADHGNEPFFHFFLALYYEQIDDTPKVMHHCRAFLRAYRRPVFDFFVENAEQRLQRAEKRHREAEQGL